MAKWLISFLNLYLLAGTCSSQSLRSNTAENNCLDKKYQDSLIDRYITHGALKTNYNEPVWHLYLDSIIAICPNIAEAFQLKAIPFIKFGDYASAMPLEDKAVALDPKNWTAYRGFLKCIFTKDYQGSIIDFQKAQLLTPNGGEMDHTYFFYQGLCNLELGNYNKAVENFRQDILIQTNGDSTKVSDIHFNTSFYFGVLYFEMNDNDKAKEFLQRCLYKYKQNPDANFYLAMVYKREKNFVLMNKYFEIAKESLYKNYSLNEDNVVYINYPHQISLNNILEEEIK
jgi:tetratricopeptide (TPR) repeat protein